MLALNNAARPAVSELARPQLEELVEWAMLALVVEGAVGADGGAEAVGAGRASAGLAGFLLCLGPGCLYTSPNYRWFADRYAEFAYVDRVVVAPAWRRRGVGSLLYDAVTAAAGPRVVTCEVNLVPPNPESLAFHARRGVVEVGRQLTEGGAKEVALLASHAPPPSRGSETPC